MTSYIFFFNQATFENKRTALKMGAPALLDHVGMADKRPYNQYQAGDELFIVGIDNKRVLLAGRIVVASSPVPRERAVLQSGKRDLWPEAKLICFATSESIETFRTDFPVPIELMKQLTLFTVDNVETDTKRLREGDPGENIFRAGPRLSPESAALLRTLLGVRGEEGVGIDAADDEAEPGIADDDEYRNRAIKTRRGQAQFRRRLLDEYARRCVVTGCDIEDLLEAAHITPHAEMTDYRVSNGLLLRSDIHTLFDLYLLAVDERYRVVVSRSLVHTEYWQYNGRSIRLPGKSADQPNRDALRVRACAIR